MKTQFLAAVILPLAPVASALEGQVQIHDPSTIVVSDGKYYTYGTGGLPTLASEDGWTWQRGGNVMQELPDGRSGPATLEKGGTNSWAPDIIKLGDRYFMYYSAPATQPRAAIALLTNKTLDPSSPDYKWVDEGPIVWSDGVEDCNAIDAGLFLDPTDGRLWLTYGSYFGYIRLVELDPKTGKRVNPDDKPVDIAINCEASIMIYRDGWYYMLATHGSCCAGANSTYNIRMGRSRKVTGPFLDNMDIDMLMGGGKLFAASTARKIGPGHFGLLEEGDGVQKFSIHYEADLDRGGISVLEILPLQWRDGWPVAGENPKEGTFEIQSVRTGTVLELAVQGTPVGGLRPRRAGGGPPGAGGPGAGGPGAGGPGAGGPGAGGPGGPGGPPPPPIPDQVFAEVSANWPKDEITVRMGQYMLQAQQKWALTPVPDAGGYPGAPYFKITIAGTERALAATKDGELTTVAIFSGAPEQLWRLDQLTDGTWRISVKPGPVVNEPLALSAIGSSFATLAKFDPDSDKQRWNLNLP